MAPTRVADNDYTTVLGQEDFVYAPASVPAGTYVFNVRPTNFAAGDVLEARIYKKLRPGGTAVVVYKRTFRLRPTDDAAGISLPAWNTVVEANGLRWSLKHIAGTTGRNVEWSIEFDG